MTLGDAFRSAFENLATHKLRSVLTMLGMIFGVGAVIAMLSIGEGAEREALAMIERLGVRNILVRDIDMRDEDLQEVRETSLGVSPRDATAIADAVAGVELTCRAGQGRSLFGPRPRPHDQGDGPRGRELVCRTHQFEDLRGRFFDCAGRGRARPGVRDRR